MRPMSWSGAPLTPKPIPQPFRPCGNFDGMLCGRYELVSGILSIRTLMQRSYNIWPLNIATGVKNFITKQDLAMWNNATRWSEKCKQNLSRRNYSEISWRNMLLRIQIAWTASSGWSNLMTPIPRLLPSLSILISAETITPAIRKMSFNFLGVTL